MKHNRIEAWTNGQCFADIFKCNSLYENVWISSEISLKHVSEDLTYKKIGIGSGNGLAPNKQQFMTKPILIQFFDAICYH